MPEFSRIIARLKKHYGKPEAPPAKGPFELVLWENACYLLPDERRLQVFEGLRDTLRIVRGIGHTTNIVSDVSDYERSTL